MDIKSSEHLFRGKSTNYTKYEKELLWELSVPHEIIINDTSNRKAIANKKDEIWSKIAIAFNNSPNVTYRNVESLRKAYRNLRHALKKCKNNDMINNLRNAENDGKEFMQIVINNERLDKSNDCDDHQESEVEIMDLHKEECDYILPESFGAPIIPMKRKVDSNTSRVESEKDLLFEYRKAEHRMAMKKFRQKIAAIKSKQKLENELLLLQIEKVKLQKTLLLKQLGNIID